MVETCRERQGATLKLNDKISAMRRGTEDWSYA